MRLELTSENYTKGFLIDECWMAGVARTLDLPDSSNFSGKYGAFVTDVITGEAIAYEEFTTLELALESLGRLDRTWRYEPISSCGGGCSATGSCRKS